MRDLNTPDHCAVLSLGAKIELDKAPVIYSKRLLHAPVGSWIVDDARGLYKFEGQLVCMPETEPDFERGGAARDAWAVTRDDLKTTLAAQVAALITNEHTRIWSNDWAGRPSADPGLTESPGDMK